MILSDECPELVTTEAKGKDASLCPRRECRRLAGAPATPAEQPTKGHTIPGKDAIRLVGGPAEIGHDRATATQSYGAIGFGWLPPAARSAHRATRHA